MTPEPDHILQLELAALVAQWLENMAEVVTRITSGDAECDAETYRVLISAQGSLLRWRLESGELAGLLKLKPVAEWVDDELD